VKKFLVLFFLLGAIGYWYRHQHSVGDAPDPATISAPVYAEMRIALEINGRTFDQVILVAAMDQAECAKMHGVIQKVYGPNAPKSGQNWTMKSSECKTEIEPRYVKVFDNRPTYVTYLSLGRGDLKERETRIVTWGVSVEESNMLCDGMAKTVRERKGNVACIRAEPT
jgi:hypothetical protein